MNTLDYTKLPIEIPSIDRRYLADLFRELDFKIGAEIGVLSGDYSKILCEANPELKLYCIDSWGLGDKKQKMRDYHIRMYEKAKKKLAICNAVLVRKLSMDAVKDIEDGLLDFVYIDASHRDPYITQDIVEWSRKIRPRGIVSGHDYNNKPLVMKAVNAYIEAHGYDLHLTDIDADKHGIQSWWFIK
ncbi:MAG: class I SAM-dependent methyltransferase [Patescibacteria group bacterium]